MADHKGDTSVLAEKIGQAYQGLKQGPSRGTLLLIGLAAVVVALVFSWRYFLASSRRDASGRWMRLDGAVFPGQLEELVNDKELKTTAPGQVARFREARRLLYEGRRELGMKAPLAFDRIRRAGELYEELAKESLPTPQLTQEAFWGVAQANESLGNIDKATEWYKKLTENKEHKDSALAKDAQKQLERLSSEANKADLNRIVEQYRPPEGVGK
jgi:hypothetical protein